MGLWFTIIRRIWHFRQLLSVLFVSMCLVSGFFALQSLYLHQMSGVVASTIVRSARQEQVNVTLSSSQQLEPSIDEILEEELGDIISESYRFSHAGGKPTSPTQGLICGYKPILDENGNEIRLSYAAGPPDNCYYLYAYPELTSIFELVNGRYPEHQPPQQTDDLPVIEGLITTTIANITGLATGDEFIIGDELPSAFTLKIVGLTQPLVDESHELWNGHRGVLAGFFTPLGLETRYDFGVVIPVEDFDSIAPITANFVTYYAFSGIDPDALTAQRLETLTTSLDQVDGRAHEIDIGIDIISGLPYIIGEYQRSLGKIETPILALSTAILVLMLYHVATTASLILDQQKLEWTIFTLRGASNRQLLAGQFMTLSLFGVFSSALGPLIAAVILTLIKVLGASDTLSGFSLLGSISFESFALSFVAAAVGVFMLTVQSYPVARQSQLQVKTFTHRPSSSPRWMRYHLDVVLVIVGIGFLLRLYLLVGGSLIDSLQTIVEDPASMIRLIASQGEEANILGDPFNLAGPLLLLTGLALIWLRLFPALVRFLEWSWQWLDNMAIAMALRNVERNPGHYAQLVLMLIGILALGTASVSLSETHDRGARVSARQDIGADMRVSFDASQMGEAPDWDSLPGVISAETLIYLQTGGLYSSVPTRIIGVEPESIPQTFPETAHIRPYFDNIPPFNPGLLLPDDARELHLQIYSDPQENIPTQVYLELGIVDRLGTPYSIAMTTVDSFASGRFVDYYAVLPSGENNVPWRIVQLSIMSEREDDPSFEHTIYLDEITVIHDDKRETVIENFEREENLWTRKSGDNGLRDVEYSDARAAGGNSSLKITYRQDNRNAFNRVSLLVVNQSEPRIPVVVSEAFAVSSGLRTATTDPLTVGDTGALDMDLTLGLFRLRYEIVGVVETFPTLNAATDYFVIASFDRLIYELNTTNPTTRQHYEKNQAWVDFDTTESVEVTMALVENLEGVTEVNYANERYAELKRDPLLNTITDMFLAGFWVALALGALDFTFYLLSTFRKRAVSFAILRAMGWSLRAVWGMLLAEQAALIIPALLIGSGLGILLAYLLLPFLGLTGNQSLQLPFTAILSLMGIFIVIFAVILVAISNYVGREPVNTVLRQEDMQI